MRRSKKTVTDTLPGLTDRQIASLVTLLAENATIVVSGARVAREIGVSRSTVWKWVERLRELGVRVKGHPRTGYFLEKVPDILTADMLRQRPKLAPVQAPLLTMMAGLSAHTAIQTQTGLAVDLKWPNDLLVGGKKVGGILTEMHAEPAQVRFVIVGIGLNVNQEKFPAELAATATSL